MKQTSNHSITGTVLPGMKKGTGLGASTANLDIALAKDLPPGLYTADIKIGQEKFAGLLYYGYNSLSKTDCLEAHIFNFSEDIYGQEIEITTKHFLREPIKFKNREEMMAQIKKDIELSK